MEHMQVDVVIVGGGSAGVGAAYRLSRAEKPPLWVAVIERNPGLGGVSVFGGVNCWEPGLGGQGVHEQLAGALLGASGAACVGRQTETPDSYIRWGMSRRCDAPYEATFWRANLEAPRWRRLHFEPQAMADAMAGLFAATPQICFLFETELVDVQVQNGVITAVQVMQADGQRLDISAKLFLDCSGDISLARQAGCQARWGEEAQAVFHEPSAPEEVLPGQVNGVSWIFRVSPRETELEEALARQAAEVDVESWLDAWVRSQRLLSQINEYPNGDLNVNMLPTMEGSEFMALERAEAAAICRARIFRYWQWMQQEKGFSAYHISRIFPMPGIRESWRLAGDYTLLEQDVRAGLFAQPLARRVVALADHALDTHGSTHIKGARCPELVRPYGIPYDCMMPREVENLLVACRGSSMSHIAASSARLSRTMLALGEAAGEAAVLCLECGISPTDMPVETLRCRLGIPAYEQCLAQRGYPAV